MFKNLININDALKLFKIIRAGRLKEIISRILKTKEKKIKCVWKKTEYPPIKWFDIPAVQERWNYLISGNKEVNYYSYTSDKYFSNRKELTGLSLACGAGQSLLKWVELGNFKSIDAYDLSETRIEYAKNQAKEKGYDLVVNYQIGDVYKIKVIENHYDVVICEGALHHFIHLEEILIRIGKFLKTDSFFIVNDYIGPARCQWTDRQLEIINGLLSILPEKYKIEYNSKSVKPKVFRPSRLSMILSDPSEAAQSSKIVPLLKQHFDIIEFREYGGTILQLLFSDIANNFLSDDSETKNFLSFCFNIEDILLKSKDIRSDFAVIICKKKKNKKSFY